MQSHVIDINQDVASARGFRAAAALPRFVALCCVIFGLLLPFLQTNGWRTCFALFACAGITTVIAMVVERGRVWAVWLLAALLLAATVLFAIAVIWQSPQSSISEPAKAAGGAALLLVPAWFLVSLGLRAIRHRRASPRQQPASLPRIWTQLPKGARLRKAIGTFGTAILIHLCGILIGGLVGFAMGGHALIGAFVYLPVARLGGRIWNRGQRQLTLSMREVRLRDARTHVLLLRSFADDDLPLLRGFRLLWFLHSAKEAFTLEQFIVDRIWQVGPVIAIGNPKDELSPLGAAREYVPDAAWRAEVRRFLSGCSCVVSILGATPGLNWELQQLDEGGAGVRPVVVVIPPIKAVDIQRRWTVFQKVFRAADGITLPWEASLGVPLLAIFPCADAPILIFCRYRNETAYSVAFDRLAEILNGIGVSNLPELADHDRRSGALDPPVQHPSPVRGNR